MLARALIRSSWCTSVICVFLWSCGLPTRQLVDTSIIGWHLLWWAERDRDKQAPMCTQGWPGFFLIGEDRKASKSPDSITSHSHVPYLTPMTIPFLQVVHIYKVMAYRKHEAYLLGWSKCLCCWRRHVCIQIQSHCAARVRWWRPCWSGWQQLLY